MKLDAEIIVVGAGAAGLWAAARAAELLGKGGKVLLLEKTARAGAKILASGGTRCNLTTTLGADEAAALFGVAQRFVQPAMRGLPPSEVRARFLEMGVETIVEPELEKVFPKSQRAVDVRDALLKRVLAVGVEIRYGAQVLGVLAGEDGAWRVTLEGGDLRCAKLLVCAGGQSYPGTGTTGDGYGWLRALGLKVVAPVPALVPLKSSAAWVHELSGLTVAACEARALDGDGRILARRRRPVLFTHQGLSGPGAMDVSEPVSRAHFAGVFSGGGQDYQVAIDLLPDVSEEELRQRLADGARAAGGPTLSRVLAKVLEGEELPGRLMDAVFRQAVRGNHGGEKGVEKKGMSLSQIDRSTRNKLVEALKGLRVPVNGTLGWEKAEVTAGGLALSEVDRKTMAVRKHAGLYVFGELLDLSGPIGGLNFQAAFATAELAAAAAVKALKTV